MAFVPSASSNSRSTTHLANYQSRNSAHNATRRRFGVKEHTLNYAAVVGDDAQCPQATGWLSKARAAKKADTKGSASPLGRGGSPRDARPALRFVHGFYPAHLPPITRANDPFWNLRALDNALAEHDGYMLILVHLRDAATRARRRDRYSASAARFRAAPRRSDAVTADRRFRVRKPAVRYFFLSLSSAAFRASSDASFFLRPAISLTMARSSVFDLALLRYSGPSSAAM